MEMMPVRGVREPPWYPGGGMAVAKAGAGCAGEAFASPGAAAAAVERERLAARP